MGGSSRGQGAATGAEKANVWGNVERAAKAPGNNPGARNTPWRSAGYALGTRQAQDAYKNARSSVGRAAAGGAATRGPR